MGDAMPSKPSNEKLSAHQRVISDVEWQMKTKLIEREARGQSKDYEDAISDVLNVINELMNDEKIKPQTSKYINSVENNWHVTGLNENSMRSFLNRFYPRGNVRTVRSRTSSKRHSKNDINRFLRDIKRNAPDTTPAQIAGRLEISVSDTKLLYETCKKAKIGIDMHTEKGFYLISPVKHRNPSTLEVLHL